MHHDLSISFDGTSILATPGIPSIRLDVRLKQLGGKRRGVSWAFPRLCLYLDQLRRNFPDAPVDESVNQFDFEWGSREKALPGEHPQWCNLYEYQRQAVRFLLSSRLRGSLLALSPGLGKTVVSIVAAELLQAQKVLIVAPLSLLPTWLREVRRWGSSEAGIARGSGPVAPWTITNYDNVVRRTKMFTDDWDVVILDESIMVKNRDTVRFRNLKIALSRTKKIWLLSGSPISKAVDDLWAQFHLIDPPSFPSYWRFAETYCTIDNSPWGRGVVGSRSNIDYQVEFRDLMFVRNQKDVLDLPESLYEVVDCDLLPAQKKVYKTLVADFIATLTSGEIIPVVNRVSQIVRLQQVVSNLGNIDPELDVSSKLDTLVDLISSGHIVSPTIVWTHWTSSANLIYKRLSKENRVGLITGETSNREAVLTSYLNGEIDILVLSIGVGKYGLTLTNTYTVVYFEKSFDMDAFVQSSFRVTRIGLDHQPVVITLRCPGTVDELVEENLAEKSIDIAKITSADLARFLAGLGRGIP